MSDRKKELRHDRHTVSLLTDHLVITPKYRGKVLTGEVAFIAEGVIRGTCAEMGIKLIDIAVRGIVTFFIDGKAEGMDALQFIAGWEGRDACPEAQERKPNKQDI